jgi:prolycopene isomerase
VADFQRDNLSAYLEESFPAEKENLKKLFLQMDKFYRQFDRYLAWHLPAWLNMLLSFFCCPEVIRITGLAAEEYLKKYIRDRRLRAIISGLWGFLGLPPQRLSAFYYLVVFREYFSRPTSYIRGGFKEFFSALAQGIQESGSEVLFNKTVKKISTDKNRVKAVVLESGEEFFAKAVVSNANAIDTLCSMVDAPATAGHYLREISTLEKSISAFQVYLGLDIPAKKLGMDQALFIVNNSYGHNESFQSSLKGDYGACGFNLVDHSQSDPGLVPEGKGSLMIMALDSFAPWRGLSGPAYKEKKEEAARRLIQRAEKLLPGLSAHIEVMEIATPKTMQRYTLSPEGAIYGFAHTAGQSGINRFNPKTRIKGLFLAGAWTQPGAGVHGCFESGINTAELVLNYLRHA